MAMKTYRTKFMKLIPNYQTAIARVHPHGYFSRDRQSKIALKWLKFMANEYNIPLADFKMSENANGEFQFFHFESYANLGEMKVRVPDENGQIHTYKLDGYYKVQTKFTLQQLEQQVLAQIPMPRMQVGEDFDHDDDALTDWRERCKIVLKDLEFQHRLKGRFAETEDDVEYHEYVFEFHGWFLYENL